MRLDSALKLYIGLYVLCFMVSWLISVPMLVHVSPQSECLLFVTRSIQYGDPATCYIIGFLPIVMAVSSIILIVLLIMQLRSLYAYLRKPGPHLSDYHQRPTHIFWRMIVFHGIVLLVVIAVASILTAGYVATCDNLYQDIRHTLRGRLKADLWGGEGSNSQYEVFANDRSIDRYTNMNRDAYGRQRLEHSITCRNLLTDRDVHSQLKENHSVNPYYKQYYGSYYGIDYADVGNIQYFAYRNNTILEICLAGAWLSVLLWSVILILMLCQRKYLKQHHGDESVLGDPRRSSSRLSNQSFDKMSGSRYSNYSGSQMSGSRRGGSGYGGRRSNYNPNGSYHGSVRSNGTPSRYGSSQQQRSTPQRPIVQHQSRQPEYSQDPQQSNLLNYFAQNPPQEEEIDIDAALQDQTLEPQDQLDHNAPHYQPEFNDTSMMDTSFELPVIEPADGLGGPYPLGDEVSSGHHIRDIPIQQNGYTEPQVQPQQQPQRVTGRRGARHPNYAPSPSYDNQHSLDIDREPADHGHVPELSAYPPPEVLNHDPPNEVEYNPPLQQHTPSSGYRRHLGNQSMI